MTKDDVVHYTGNYFGFLPSRCYRDDGIGDSLKKKTYKLDGVTCPACLLAIRELCDQKLKGLETHD